MVDWRGRRNGWGERGKSRRKATAAWRRNGVSSGETAEGGGAKVGKRMGGWEEGKAEGGALWQQSLALCTSGAPNAKVSPAESNHSS